MAEHIQIKLNVRHVNEYRAIINRPVSDDYKGQGHAECDCGQHFAAFETAVNDEYVAYVDAIQRQMQIAMHKHGFPAPVGGSVNLRVIVTVPRPKYHFLADKPSNGIKARYANEKPTTAPDMAKVLAVVSKAISGIAMDGGYSVGSFDGTDKVYGPEASIEITISQRKADSHLQPELF